MQTIRPYDAFIALLRSPSRGLETLQCRTVRSFEVVLFLTGVGLLRGIVDIPWIYWQAGRLELLVPSLSVPSWYVLNIGPFIAAEIVTALLRWVLFSAIVYGLGRFLGGQGSFRISLSVYGALLGITLVTILIDYLHLWLPLPLVRFSVSARYNPIIGVGQITTSLWIGYLTYLLARRAYGLANWPALMVGAFVPLLNTGLFLIVARMLFGLVPTGVPQNILMIVFNVGFVIAGLSAFVVLLWWGRRRKRTRPLATNRHNLVNAAYQSGDQKRKG